MLGYYILSGSQFVGRTQGGYQPASVLQLAWINFLLKTGRPEGAISRAQIKL